MPTPPEVIGRLRGGRAEPAAPVDPGSDSKLVSEPEPVSEPEAQARSPP